MADSVGDAGVITSNINMLLSDLSENRRRHTRFTDADAEVRVAGMSYLHENMRLGHSSLSQIVTAGIAGQAPSAIQPLRELAERAVQSQPQQQTMNDPAWRQPPPPPVQSGIKAA